MALIDGNDLPTGGLDSVAGTRRFWIGVASRDHVNVAVKGAFVQLNHGKKAPLGRLKAGDGVIMYSPRTAYPDGEPLQAFTAIGTVVTGDVYQVQVTPGFKPHRVEVQFVPSKEAHIKPLVEHLFFIIGAVLTGSVRHAGSQVRVGVQLLAAPGGETMWSEQYDRTVANIFDVQSDIAVRVARALEASLAPDERRRIERVPTANAEAYELYLQQGQLPFGVPAQNQQGIALLQKAIALDPQFALGYALLAQRFVWTGSVHGRAEYLRGVDAGRNAVRIDPQLAPGHHGLGMSLNRAGQVEEARLSMQRAIELNSNYSEAMWDLGFLELNAGRLDQAAYWTMRAWPLAPNVPTSYYHLALSLIFLDPALAERWLDAGLARFKSANPSSVVRLVMQRAILALRRGDHAAAVAQVRDAVRLRPDYYGARSLLAELATYAGTADAGPLVDAAVKESPSGRGWWQAYTPRTLRAHLYLRAGRPDRARPLLETVLDINRKAIEEGDRSDKPWSENVAVHAMLGDREAALQAWERAVEIGFVEDKTDVFDALIAPVKDDPRFIAALDRVRRRTAEMRARVDLTVIDEWIARGAPTNAVR